MKELPKSPDLSHLKKQAKDLLKASRAGDEVALERLRAGLPSAAGRDGSVLSTSVHLHDAQSCIAREYGFASWTQLKDYVEAEATESLDDGALLRRWTNWTFGAGYEAAKPALAARLLADHPRLLASDPALACAVGDVSAARAAIAADPEWARARTSPARRSPLANACFSAFVRLPEHAPAIRACAALLLEAGADANDTMVDPALPNEPLGVLYGAAGRNHDAPLTKLLLEAGANPNDGESLYHATESADPACLRLLLEAGARVAGTNALHHALDYERPETIALLLSRGADPNETTIDAPLTHALRRRRSPGIVRMLLDAGANPSSTNPQGISAHRLAQRMGLTAVAAMLRDAGAVVEDNDAEAFLAACARADKAAATAILAVRPRLIVELSDERLRLLADLAGAGASDAVRLMVELGWPIAVPGGDIDGSALNHAVFRGDRALAEFLLANGASYDERHRFNDNVYGTLSFASLAQTTADGDWVGCAKALVASGAPLPESRYTFAEDVAAYFDELRAEH